jgi:hypothetical protein
MTSANGDWDILRKGVMAFLHDRNILRLTHCKENNEGKVEKLIETAIAVHDILCNPKEDCDKFEYLKVTLQRSLQSMEISLKLLLSCLNTPKRLV